MFSTGLETLVRRNLLVVSDSALVRESLARRLREQGYTITLVATGEEALRVVRHVSVDAVLLESRYDDVAAERLQDAIRRERPNCRVAHVANLGRVRNPAELLRLGGDDYVLGAGQLLALMQPASEAGGSPPHTGRAVRALIQIVDVLVGLMELDDPHFHGSSHQAMRLARAMAQEFAEEEEVVQEVTLAALLRDIGRAGVDGEVLAERGEYTREQAGLMQEHVEASVRLLEHIDLPWKLLPAVRHHHERYDGQGYPDGLRAREIPLGARILAVVDSYLAMTSDRAHRPARDPADALAEIERHAGSQFDPEVVEFFLRIERGRRVRGTARRPRVLVIDPDRHFCKMLRMRLLNEGFEVTTRSNLRRGRRLVEKNPPALALLSVEPDLAAALQLVREIREHETLHGLPLALLSGTDDRIAKVRALRQGADDFLVKDGDREELIARVESIVSREESRRGGAVERRGGVAGRLENMSLPDIVQTLSMGMKTARVELSDGKTRGDLWFREGRIEHAALGPEQGEEAVFRMLRWQTGTFLIRHGITAERSTIDADPMFLILEGLRRLDDESAADAEAS